MSRIDVLVETALIATLAAGCGGARVVSHTPGGGVIALEGDRNAAMEQAGQMMADQCGGAYQIVEEGEDLAVANESAAEESGDQATDDNEWRLRYTCEAEPAAAPAPAGAAGRDRRQAPAEGGGPERAPAPADRGGGGGAAGSRGW